MSKVYLVTAVKDKYYSECGVEIVGVFTTEEKAYEANNITFEKIESAETESNNAEETKAEVNTETQNVTISEDAQQAQENAVATENLPEEMEVAAKKEAVKEAVKGTI